MCPNDQIDITSRLHHSILELCKASIPRAEGVEVDGIICITLGKHTTEQIVVKIHEVLWKNSHSILRDHLVAPKGNASQGLTTSVANEANREVGVLSAFTTLVNSEGNDSLCNNVSGINSQKRPNKRKSSRPIAIVNSKQSRLEMDDDMEYPLDIDCEESQNSSDVLNQDVDRDNDIKPICINPQNDENGLVVHDSQVPQPISVEPSEVYICDVCKVCFIDSKSYSHHLEVSQHGQINSCRYCNKKAWMFPTFNAFMLHVNNHNSNSSGDIWKGKPVRCGICNLLLRSKRGILDHMTLQHQHTKCYSCITCEEIYPDFNSFRRHRIQNHLGVDQCRCEMCDLFFTFTEYKDHEKECKIKIFNTDDGQDSPENNFNNTRTPENKGAWSLKLKIKKDSFDNFTSNVESKDWKPEDKVKGSPLNDSIIRVGKIPSGEKCQIEGPYRCQTCFSIFQEFDQYEIHSHEMHSRFVCTFCAHSFATKRNLRRHARRHTGVRPYKCYDCEESFTRDDDLKKHMFKCNHMTKFRFRTNPASQVSGNLSMSVNSGVETVEINSDHSNDSLVIHQGNQPKQVEVMDDLDNSDMRQPLVNDTNENSNVDSNEAAFSGEENGIIVHEGDNPSEIGVQPVEQCTRPDEIPEEMCFKD